MQDYITALLICTVTMSALALLYMAATPLLARRYSAKGRYYAWLIVIVGLVIPFRPQFENPIVKVDMPKMAAPAIQIGNGTPIHLLVQDATQTVVTSNISWWQIAMAVWLAGVMIFLAHHAVKHIRFMKMTRRWSEHISDEEILSLFQGLKAEMRISKQVNLYLCPCVGSPTMTGIVKPCILLPTIDLAQDELRFILKHELVHYRRKDLWYKGFVLIATAIHWFNPVVCLIAKAINMLCEISCDAEIVYSTDADTRRQYSETIIGVVKYHSKMNTALSTTFYGGRKGMKDRILSIMDMGKKKAGLTVLCCVLILTLGTGMAVAVSSNNNNGNMIASATDNQNTEAKQSTKQEQFAIYEQFGLVYNEKNDTLFYNGQQVRYFIDQYSVGDYGTAIMQEYLNEQGVIDVYAMRDLESIQQITDGSYDPSGVLTGIGIFSQGEYNARDIDAIKNPKPNVAISGGYQTSEEYTRSMSEMYSIYEIYGLTYDTINDRLLFNGQVVRYFVDVLISAEPQNGVYSDIKIDGKTVIPASMRGGVLNSSGSVDVYAVRDYSTPDDNGYGKLINVKSYTKEEFDARTESLNRPPQSGGEAQVINADN